MDSFSRRKPFQYSLVVILTAALLGAIMGKLFCEIEDYFMQKEYRLECLEQKVAALEKCRVLGGFGQRDKRLCTGEELPFLRELDTSQ